MSEGEARERKRERERMYDAMIDEALYSIGMVTLFHGLLLRLHFRPIQFSFYISVFIISSTMRSKFNIEARK